MPGLAQTDPRAVRFLKYPYHIGGNGIPSTTSADDHLRDLIVQVLFTCPGERVNLPEFGVGIQRLVFEPNSDALRASTQFLISANLRRWLGDRIDLGQVQVTIDPDIDADRLISRSPTPRQGHEPATKRAGPGLTHVEHPSAEHPLQPGRTPQRDAGPAARRRA